MLLLVGRDALLDHLSQFQRVTFTIFSLLCHTTPMKTPLGRL